MVDVKALPLFTNCKGRGSRGGTHREAVSAFKSSACMQYTALTDREQHLPRVYKFAVSVVWRKKNPKNLLHEQLLFRLWEVKLLLNGLTMCKRANCSTLSFRLTLVEVKSSAVTAWLKCTISFYLPLSQCFSLRAYAAHLPHQFPSEFMWWFFLF